MRADSMQVSSTLRRAANAYMHWCPGCLEMHALPDGWAFNGDVNCPTFMPSFHHKNARGVCHYTLTAGVMTFHADCDHAFRNRVVPLPDLPIEMQDTPEF